MAALRLLLNAFLGGEIDPLLAGRVDTDQHALGLTTCENFVCINEGPLVKRTGFHYVCDAASTASWLGAFRFSVTQEYLIEWSQLKARFYTNEARIETSPGVAYEVTTPYSAADAPRLSTQQSWDRLYIDHGSYPPAALTRTGATTFSHANTVLNNGPFRETNRDDTITVSASGTFTKGGTVTITASSGIFAASDVGSQFRMEAKDFSTIKAWEPGMASVAIGEVVRSDGKAYTAESAGSTGSRVPIHEDGAEYDGQGKQDVVNTKGPYGILWRYRHDRFGVVKITGFTSATQVTAEVVRRLPDSLASVATPKWALAAFSATRGWPSLVLHAYGRQFHIKDFDLVGTVVDDYGGGQANFETLSSSGSPEADLGFRRTLAVSNPPIWALPDKRLVLGTADFELAVGAINPSQALSGSNIQSEQQSFYGSEAVWPLQVGTQTIFVERGGRRIRSTRYDISQERYVPEDLTAGCSHVTGPGIVQLAAQRVPSALLHAVRGDGQIAVHALTRLDLKGFSRTVLGGDARALSAVSIVGSDGKTDQLWLLVERTRADGVKREIWRQADWRKLGDDPAEQFYVDAGRIVTVTGGTRTITGATHLAGEEIAVLVNGAVVPNITVLGDGSFTLPAEVVPAANYTLVYGLPYTALAVTTRAEAKLQRVGTIQGLRKRVRKAVLRLLETIGVQVGAIDGELEELTDRPASAAMDAPVPLFSGDTEGPIEMDYDTDGRVRIVSDLPLAATIAAAVLSLEVDEADG